MRVITSRLVTYLSGGQMASSTWCCDWPVHPRVSSCDIQDQPQLATPSLYYYFFLLVADQALGIFINWSKRIDSLKPVPSQAADLIDMVMRQGWPAGRPCFSQHEILVWRFLFFPQEQAYERCLIWTDWRWTCIAHSEMYKFSSGVLLCGPFFISNDKETLIAQILKRFIFNFTKCLLLLLLSLMAC